MVGAPVLIRQKRQMRMQLDPVAQMTGREGRAFGHLAGQISAGVRPALRGLVCASRARSDEAKDEDAKEFHARPLALSRRCRIGAEEAILSGGVRTRLDLSADRRSNRARRWPARSRASTCFAICTPSAGVIPPCAMALRTAESTCRTSSIVRNDDRSIPRRAAG